MVIRGPWLLFCGGLVVAATNLVGGGNPNLPNSVVPIAALEAGKTTGTTAGSSPYAPSDYSVGKSVYEYLSKNTYLSAGWSNKHTVRLNVHLGTISLPATIHVQDSGGAWHDQPLTLVSAGYTVCVANPYGLGEISGVSSGNYHSGTFATSATTTTSGVWVTVAPGTTVPIHLCGTGNLSAGTVTVVTALSVVVSYPDPDTSATVTITDNSSWNESLPFGKSVCDDASIDTRKAYGQADVDGHIPGDANADLRPLNFGPWKHKGGLFVGNIAYVNNDQSGLARIQLWTGRSEGHSDAVKGACVSLFDKGAPSRPSVSGDFSVSMFAPKSDDPNLSITESTATFSNAWYVHPRESGDPTGPDERFDPIATVSLSGSGGDYANWQLTNTSGYLPNNTIARLVLTMENESWGGIWRYFASKEFQADHTSTFPESDSAPRVWIVTSSLTGSWWTRS